MHERSRFGNYKIGLIVAAIVSAVFLGWAAYFYFSSYQEMHSNQRQSAAEYQANAAQKGPDACSAEAGLIVWITCLVEAVSTDGGREYADYDLQAQQDMAEWALGVVIVSAATLLVTTVGVIFVFLTLRETSAAVSAARDANEILRAEQRPWLAFDIEDFGEWSVIPDQGIVGRPKVRVENFGKSPAFKVFVRISVLDVDTLNLELIDREVAKRSSLGFGATIFPGKKRLIEGGYGVEGIDRTAVALSPPAKGWWIIFRVNYSSAAEVYTTIKVYRCDLPSDWGDFTPNVHHIGWHDEYR